MLLHETPLILSSLYYTTLTKVNFRLPPVGMILTP